MTDTPNTTQGKGAIDWTKPIEAVHEDGNVHPVQNTGKSTSTGCYWVRLANTGYWVAPEWPKIAGGWTIRNVETRDDTVTPEHPTPTQYAPELVERAFALIRKMAERACASAGRAMLWDDYAEARSIVSDLPQEVEPILKAEIRILGRNGVHDVSLAELGRLIAGGARITSLKGVEAERGDAA